MFALTRAPMGSPRAARSRQPGSVIAYTRSSIAFPMRNVAAARSSTPSSRRSFYSISRVANCGTSRFSAGSSSCAPSALVVGSQFRRLRALRRCLACATTSPGRGGGGEHPGCFLLASWAGVMVAVWCAPICSDPLVRRSPRALGAPVRAPIVHSIWRGTGVSADRSPRRFRARWR